jgi:signal transduction histidine kinase
MSQKRRLRKLGCCAVPKGWTWVFCWALCAISLPGQNRDLVAASSAGPESTVTTLTHALQARRLAGRKGTSICDVRLEGVVLWASPAQDRFILEDDSGGLMVKMDLPAQPTVSAGRKVLIEGNALAGEGAISSGPLIDNDGIHSAAEKSATLFLSAGLHPITVEWFNNLGQFALTVDWQGPGMTRQPIPEAALFRAPSNSATGAERLAPGLDYSCYEGQWDLMPVFSKLPAVKRGAVPNFDLHVRSRDINVGLAFSGYLEAPQSGQYSFWLKSDDGGKLFLFERPLRLTVLGTAPLPLPHKIIPGQIVPDEQEYQRAQTEGVVTQVTKGYEGLCLEMTSGLGRAYLKVMEGNYDSMRLLLHNRVRATGVYQSVYAVDGQPAPALLVSSLADILLVEMAPANRKTAEQTDGAKKALPVLTKVIQVISLSRKEAQRAYPVRIQGVITARTGLNFFIQDATSSIYAEWNDSGAMSLPKVGDYWEIEGESYASFAPSIRVHHAVYLRPGILPEPLRPAGDELINGSFTTKYVEIQGIATAVNDNDLTLLTREGNVSLELIDLEPKDLACLSDLEDALIHVRGICSPNRDKDQSMLPLVHLRNASVSLDEPAPAHPFETPLKRVADLFLFDARADALRRVRIAGQVVHERNGEYFLMDGANGLRFKPKTPVQLLTGDLVEVVGFPDMRGSSPVLRQAVARRAGKTSLPAAVRLPENGILNGKLDATLVCLDSRLVSASVDSAEQVLELQCGNRGFVARLANQRGLLSELLPGSRLELTGVYAAQGGGRMASRVVDSFELLLNSPLDVRVLERPPWWTSRRALTVVGGLALGILAALVWVALLRRQVEKRSRQLAVEVQRVEQIQRQRALEEERSRIAQDLHDDLGATLTEIRFLSAVESRDALVPPATRFRLGEVSEKSRQLVSSLDEIVWAVNPANDSLPSLGSYLRHVAEEFFRNTPVRCRLDVDQSLPLVALTSEVRHNLFLAIREALNNIARHSQATEAWLRIHWQNQTLQIAVEDNGCGFSGQEVKPPGNGLPNMRRRLEKIGGRFECDTRTGRGTVCRLYLPFT